MVPSRILVVEDNADQAKALKQALEDLGHTVLGPAPDCSSALELIWREKPDLAFVDTHLGSETCEVVLEECDQQAVPVIITSEEDGDLPDFCSTRDRMAEAPNAATLQKMFA
ncbi:response regulator [Devosia riboflavina]|uniref:response regulator n=1 Tax=Devosia riboflavina TaxID=46914 RepID=UPI00068FDDE4|nr:response regulator [Devosia riboflavina]